MKGRVNQGGVCWKIACVVRSELVGRRSRFEGSVVVWYSVNSIDFS